MLFVRAAGVATNGRIVSPSHCKGARMQPCEIIYSKNAKGWKWRITAPGHDPNNESDQTFQLFYECVVAARAEGLQPNVRCP